MIMMQVDGKQMSPNAGIAIGPILFIIAILAILAAAIAAGSGTFMGSTASESNKMKSTALVQIGENLRMGMDQITMVTGIVPDLVNFEYDDTPNNNGLFAPTGGGIAPPSPGMANDPANDQWYFLRGPAAAGFGTNGNNKIFAFLPVSQGTCQEVNNRSMGTVGIPDATNVISNTNPPTLVGTGWPDATATWNLINASGTTVAATNHPSLQGISTGCIHATDVMAAGTGPTTNYFFYQLLSVQ